MNTLIVVLALASAAMAIDNGAGQTPALGYNTWNDFRCSGITAAHVMEVADKMVALGLVDAGYEYLNIDDCWATSRGSDGQLVPDPTAFPNGMKAVADYVHGKGLLFGIYTDRGNKTCAGRPASAGYEKVDSATFASWGVDYLKEDSCNAPQDHPTAFTEYGYMRDGLNATGRVIYFSLCGWNSWYAPTGSTLGNSWRIAGDCNGWDTIYNAIRVNEGLAQYAGPGGWNDPDMLVGSNPAAAVYNTQDQARTQFSLWSVMAAPLLIGSSILNMSAFDLETYTNYEVIDIDQDGLGKQGTVIQSTCPAHDQVAFEAAIAAGTAAIPACQQIWARPLLSGAYAISFVNFATTPVTMVCDSSCLKKMGFKTIVAVRDVWAHSDLGMTSSINVTLNGNGASVLYRIEQPCENC